MKKSVLAIPALGAVLAGPVALVASETAAASVHDSMCPVTLTRTAYGDQVNGYGTSVNLGSSTCYFRVTITCDDGGSYASPYSAYKEAGINSVKCLYGAKVVSQDYDSFHK